MTPHRPLALVTGASSGLGADLARELARDGHDLVLVARRTAPMETLATELRTSGAHVVVVAADLSLAGAASKLFADVAALGLPPVEVLVNNAGLGRSEPFLDTDPAALSEMIAVNVTALTELTRLFVPGMIAARRGRVLLVASMAGYIPGPFAAVYHATKAFVVSLGEALAYELRGTGVSATTLCPGPTETGFAAVAGAADKPIFRGSAMTPVMTSKEVVRIGYRAMRKGRPVVIAGARNGLSVFSMRFIPRPLLLRMSADLNRVR